MSSVTTIPSRAELDRGLEHLRQRELARAVFLQRQRKPATVPGTPMPSAESRDLPRRACRRAEEDSRRGRRRRGLAIVDRDVLVALARMDHHEAAAADIAGAWIGHGHRKAGRDRGIDRIAARAPDFGADSAAESSCATPCRVRLNGMHVSSAGGI
jgi:hypothetical protein